MTKEIKRQYTLKIEPSLIAKAKIRAKKEDTSVSWQIRQAIKKYLK